jgi:protein-S-isoprenylcysteine O-methyltransferase Ste14
MEKKPENAPVRAPRLPLPPRLVLVLLAATAALRVFVAGDATRHPWRVGLGAAIAVAGISMTVAAARHFSRVKTNIVTFEEPTRLVVDGWFRFSRNPMYLGFALLLGGVAVVLGGTVTLLPTALFVLAAEKVYIPFEERAMTGAFGEEYLRYTQQVRRWWGRRG